MVRAAEVMAEVARAQAWNQSMRVLLRCGMGAACALRWVGDGGVTCGCEVAYWRRLAGPALLAGRVASSRSAMSGVLIWAAFCCKVGVS